jgi:hypothetical protein
MRLEKKADAAALKKSGSGKFTEFPGKFQP